MRKAKSTKSTKSKSISGICKNILIICGVITALTGAVGGIADTIGKFVSKSETDTTSYYDENGNRVNREGIVVEQLTNIPSRGGKADISKTYDTDEQIHGGDRAAAKTNSIVTLFDFKENNLTTHIDKIWVWMFGGGLGLVMSIICIGRWLNRKELNKGSQNENISC